MGAFNSIFSVWIIRSSIIYLWLLFAGFSHLAAGQEQVPEFEDQVVVVQFELGIVISEGAAKTNLPGFDRVAERYDVYKIERVYPFLDYVEPTPKTAENLAALRRTYYVRYGAQTDPEWVSRDFALESGVVYAEPVLVTRRYKSVAQTDPDDPRYNEQSYLKLVHLPEAWDLVRAEDTSDPVVIAIVDDGGDWDHEDLFANIWINEDEIPDNGIDDDNNGFIDDVHGANLGNMDDTDNEPMPLSGNSHGTFVAGIASAVTDNGVGIAGAAWNAKLMHVNVYCEEEEICNGFQGILYAASNGADIINASWGGFFEEREMLMIPQTLDLATDMGALVVAAAGNQSSDTAIYPSYPDAHPRVLSVGATEKESHQIAHFSNYGKAVDIFAPGQGIISTEPGDGYNAWNGTSFSSPLVSGIAALVKTRFPNISPDELREQLRLSGKNIDAANPSFVGLTGGGLVNAEASLQEVTNPAVRVKRLTWQDSDGNHQPGPGDEVTINVTFVNYLADAQQLMVELVPFEPYPYITLLHAEQSVGILKSGDSTMVTFRFSVAEDIPPSRSIYFSFLIREGEFTDESDVLRFSQINPRLDLVYEALRVIYKATDGDNWRFNEGWNFTTEPTTEEGFRNWYGVFVLENQLKALHLVQNNLSGTLPPEFSQAPGLLELVIALNKNLSGSIPREWGQLTDLGLMVLADNSLTGPIPPELGQLSALEELSLEYNSLNGSIPPELGLLPDLLGLYLTHNEITGPIPPELGQLPKLRILRLAKNQLSGSIPRELAQLSSLEHLYLENNQLTGTVPSELGQLSRLRLLNLANNSLTGSLPRSLMQLGGLRSLSFQGQGLCAPRDSEFQEWLQKLSQVEGETCQPVSTEETSGALPEKFVVHSNYPNPFQKTTQLVFDLPWQAHVRVELVDIIGRQVLNVPEKSMTAGWSKRIKLDGESLPAGLYLYRVIADSPQSRFVQVGRLVRIR